MSVLFMYIHINIVVKLPSYTLVGFDLTARIAFLAGGDDTTIPRRQGKECFFVSGTFVIYEENVTENSGMKSCLKCFSTSRLRLKIKTMKTTKPWCSLLGYGAGLPDGIVPNKKSQFGIILEGLAMEDVAYILWTFGLFYSQLVYVFLCTFGIF
jgi:hypothetical protein